MNKLESMVHLKAVLEADSRIDKVDTDMDNQILTVHPLAGEPIPVFLAGWQEEWAMARIVTALEGKI